MILLLLTAALAQDTGLLMPSPDPEVSPVWDDEPDDGEVSCYAYCESRRVPGAARQIRIVWLDPDTQRQHETVVLVPVHEYCCQLRCDDGTSGSWSCSGRPIAL